MAMNKELRFQLALTVFAAGWVGLGMFIGGAMMYPTEMLFVDLSMAFFVLQWIGYRMLRKEFDQKNQDNEKTD